MMLPPALLRLRLRSPRASWPTLWLPLFLLWPLLFVLFALIASFGVVALCVAAQLSVARAFELCSSTYRLVCATRGTHVDVTGPRSHVLITIY